MFSILTFCALATASLASFIGGKRPSSDFETPPRKSPSPEPILTPERLNTLNLSFDDLGADFQMNWGQIGFNTPRDQGITLPGSITRPLSLDNDDAAIVGTIISGRSLFQPRSWVAGSLPPRTIQTTTPAPC